MTFLICSQTWWLTLYDLATYIVNRLWFAHVQSDLSDLFTNIVTLYDLATYMVNRLWFDPYKVTSLWFAHVQSDLSDLFTNIVTLYDLATYSRTKWPLYYLSTYIVNRLRFDPYKVTSLISPQTLWPSMTWPRTKWIDSDLSTYKLINIHIHSESTLFAIYLILLLKLVDFEIKMYIPQ